MSPCTAATTDTGPSGPYTINQVADAYGLDGLYANGDFGAGVTVALYELEGYTTSDVAQFQILLRHERHGHSGPGGWRAARPSGSNPGLETALDVENVIGTAPSSTVDVYQGPNTPIGRLRHIPDHRQRQHGARWSATRGACASRPP